MTDFAGLIGALARGGVEFVVVGGLAATAHGSARLTQDVDVAYRRTPENLSRLVSSLASHQPYPRGAPEGLPFVWSEATVRGGLNLTVTTSLGDRDLFGEIAGGGGYDDPIPHTIVLELFGHPCRCLDLDWLLRTKWAAGRPRDLEAIAELEALREERDGS